MTNLKELEVQAYLAGAVTTTDIMAQFEVLLEESEIEIKLLEKRVDQLEEERNGLFDEISDLSQELHEKQGIIEDLEFKVWRFEEVEK
jgi:predicted  nucleic acid-binding Zn-ribbon protein